MLQESRCLRQYLNERPEKAGLRLLQAHFRIGKYYSLRFLTLNGSEHHAGLCGSRQLRLRYLSFRIHRAVARSFAMEHRNKVHGVNVIPVGRYDLLSKIFLEPKRTSGAKSMFMKYSG